MDPQGNPGAKIIELKLPEASAKDQFQIQRGLANGAANI